MLWTVPHNSTACAARTDRPFCLRDSPRSRILSDEKRCALKRLVSPIDDAEARAEIHPSIRLVVGRCPPPHLEPSP